MEDKLQSTLSELSAVTDRLEQLNPNEFASISDLLTERSKLTIRLRRMVAAREVTPDQSAIDQLSSELARGAELVRRLEVARAGLRDKYEKSAQSASLMRSLESVTPPPISLLDIQG